MVTRTVQVRPIHGWGWSDTAEAAWDYVPEPFEANVTAKTETWYGRQVPTLQGAVSEGQHEFSGYSVLLSPRHEEWDGFVNITLQSTDGRKLAGMGTMDLASFNG